jgi:hypothetical protein
MLGVEPEMKKYVAIDIDDDGIARVKLCDLYYSESDLRAIIYLMMRQEEASSTNAPASPATSDQSSEGEQ